MRFANICERQQRFLHRFWKHFEQEHRETLTNQHFINVNSCVFDLSLPLKGFTYYSYIKVSVWEHDISLCIRELFGCLTFRITQLM